MSTKNVRLAGQQEPSKLVRMGTVKHEDKQRRYERISICVDAASPKRKRCILGGDSHHPGSRRTWHRGAWTVMPVCLPVVDNLN